MRLLAYFGTMGAVLTMVLLLASFIVEPSRPRGSLPNSAVESNLSKPRILSRVEQYSATLRIAPAVQAGYSSPDPGSAAGPGISPSAPGQGSGASAVETAPVQRPVSTSKTAQRRNIDNPDAAWRRHRRDPAYSSYAQERRGPAPERRTSQSWAEGTLGPH